MCAASLVLWFESLVLACCRHSYCLKHMCDEALKAILEMCVEYLAAQRGITIYLSFVRRLKNLVFTCGTSQIETEGCTVDVYEK